MQDGLPRERLRVQTVRRASDREQSSKRQETAIKILVGQEIAINTHQRQKVAIKNPERSNAHRRARRVVEPKRRVAPVSYLRELGQESKRWPLKTY